MLVDKVVIPELGVPKVHRVEVDHKVVEHWDQADMVDLTYFLFKFLSFLKNLAVCPSRTVSFKLMKSQCNLALIDKSSNPDCQVLADFSIFSVKSVSHALRLSYYPCGKPWMDFVLSCRSLLTGEFCF